jgi:hypothetical protein
MLASPATSPCCTSLSATSTTWCSPCIHSSYSHSQQLFTALAAKSRFADAQTYVLLFFMPPTGGRAAAVGTHCTPAARFVKAVSQTELRVASQSAEGMLHISIFVQESNTLPSSVPPCRASQSWLVRSTLLPAVRRQDVARHMTHITGLAQSMQEQTPLKRLLILAACSCCCRNGATCLL